MSEKYIDLAQPIIDANDAEIDFMCSCYDRGVEAALEYFDEHPGQAPGRTITESEAWDIAGRTFHRWGSVEELASHLRGTFRQLGITVVPDPEPTNADKLAKEILASFNKCEFDLESSFEQMAKALDARGVKAPGGDDG